MATLGILTIGNEIVDGQIVNSNAAWLAKSALEINFKVSAHLSVKDEMKAILAGLTFLNQSCDLIVTTGGLGPTIDDFTRVAISQWLNAPLKLHGKCWEGIQEKLKSRGVVLRPPHKNQAYFPQDAIPIENPVGVAPGFITTSSRSLLIALPGPPSELKAIWTNSLNSFLTQNFQPKKVENLKSWFSFGVAESDVQERVLDTLKNHALVEDIGFRLYKPYVEVKAWYKPEDSHQLQDLFEQIAKQLGDGFVGHSLEAVRRPFLDFIKYFNEIHIFDPITNGFIMNRFEELGVFSKKLYLHTNQPGSESTPVRDSNILIIRIHEVGSLDARVSINKNEFSLKTIRDIPYRSRYGKAILCEQIIHLFAEEQLRPNIIRG